MSRLAAPRRRNRFVILQAVRSPPVALHPTSLRRSYLRLHVSRLHIGQTFTLLTRQHHRRTHSRESGNPEPRHARPSLDARFRGHDTDVSESSHHFERITRLARCNERLLISRPPALPGRLVLRLRRSRTSVWRPSAGALVCAVAARRVFTG